MYPVGYFRRGSSSSASNAALEAEIAALKTAVNGTSTIPSLSSQINGLKDLVSGTGPNSLQTQVANVINQVGSKISTTDAQSLIRGAGLWRGIYVITEDVNMNQDHWENFVVARSVLLTPFTLNVYAPGTPGTQWTNIGPWGNANSPKNSVAGAWTLVTNWNVQNLSVNLPPSFVVFRGQLRDGSVVSAQNQLYTITLPPGETLFLMCTQSGSASSIYFKVL